MKQPGFIALFLAVVVLAAVLVFFRGEIFGVNQTPTTRQEEKRVTHPEINYFRDERTNVCFAELSYWNGHVVTSTVACTPEVLVLVKPWPDYYR